jgi:MATE family multidrug resistance protein
MNAEEPLLIGAYRLYEAVEPRLEPIGARSEARYIAKSVGPLAVTFLLQLTLSIATIFAAGRLGPHELAAATLGVCTFNITGMAVYQGMATSLDLLCLQAYGAGKPLSVGLYFQRCLLMMLCFTACFLCPLWWWSGAILLALVPDQQLAALAQTYLRYAMVGSPGLLFFETGKRFLQAQHIFNAGTWVLVVAAPCNVVTSWWLVQRIGFVGAPLLLLLVYWLIAALLWGYVVVVDGRQCWGGLQPRQAARNWSPMLHLALPGVVMVEAEYLAFELMTILAARFGTNALAAQSIALSMGSLLFQPIFAALVAVLTRIGNYVGKEDVPAAQMVTRLLFGVAVLLGFVNFGAAFFGRQRWGRAFTDLGDVLKLSNHILVLVAINQFLDAMNVVCAGVLRGQGRQKIGLVLNLVSYYVVAIPLGYVLAFPMGMGLSGLWVGIIFGVLSLLSGQALCIALSLWEDIVERAKEHHD